MKKLVIAAVATAGLALGMSGAALWRTYEATPAKAASTNPTTTTTPDGASAAAKAAKRKARAKAKEAPTTTAPPSN